jgi:hypothetical protein
LTHHKLASILELSKNVLLITAKIQLISRRPKIISLTEISIIAPASVAESDRRITVETMELS